MAMADLVIVNGVGYDGWADKLLLASPGPTVINVGKLRRAKNGDNPHRWYNPADVRRFIAALTADLTQLVRSSAGRLHPDSSDFRSVRA